MTNHVLTLPNIITAIRWPLFLWFWYLAATGSVFALWLFIGIWALDWVDGAAARVIQQETVFGYYFDKITDRVVQVLGVVIMIRYAIVPPAAFFLMVRDIGYLPAIYPFHGVDKNWHDAGRLGKITTLLQGIGFIWLHFGWPYELGILIVTAGIGAVVAIRHLRSLVPLALVIFALPATSAFASVQINEVMWDGVEYLELYNNGSDDVHLDGWSITRQKPNGEEKDAVVFLEDDEVPAGDYYLIERSEDATTVESQKVAGSLILVNTGEFLRLYNESGVVVDEAGTLGPWPAGANTEAGIAMERVGSAWQTSSGFVGGRDGTPRRANSSGGDTTPPDTQQPTDTKPASYETPVFISEILPNPKGDDVSGEFIELYNPSGTIADISGWRIDDVEGGSKPFIFGEDISIAGGSYVVFLRSETSIALNNTGDSVRLIDPGGQTHDLIVYTGSVGEGEVYAKTAAGDFAWSTSATPGSVNIIAVPITSTTPLPKSTATIVRSPQPTVAGSSAATGVARVFIARALPNPEGPDAEGEFIELRNEESQLVSLVGWQLDDEEGGSAPYTILDDTSIAAGGVLLFSREETGIALNNTGDSVRLFDPSGFLVDVFEYGKVAEGEIIEAAKAYVSDKSNEDEGAVEVAGEVLGVQDEEKSGDVSDHKQESVPDVQHVSGEITAGVRDAQLDADVTSESSPSPIRRYGMIGLLAVGALGAASFAYGSPKELLTRVQHYFQEKIQSK